jgi:cytolysin (calcineurin-like family phosphatase)
MVGCGTVPNFPYTEVHSFDTGSLAYSWDIGSWHFVQLHNYPTYSVAAIGVSSAIAWLDNDLAAAAAAEKKVVLNLHDYAEHWSMTNPGFQAAISGKTVVAVFAGHFHGTDGLTSTVPSTSIPIFLSGAAEKNRFLLAEFGDDYLTVATISTLNGTPAFLTGALSADLNSYTVPLPPAADTDGDGVNGGSDNCPNNANGSQLDSDGDGIGDA